MQVDYDLHGIVGVRLLDAGPGDVAAVSRQLGPIQSPLDREPEITIRFVDRVAPRGQLRYLGLDEAGFTDDAFYVLRSKHKTGVKVRIPFGDVGGRCEFVCERGVPAVPFLVATINLTALARGALPLHASAFNYNGIGAVVTGWSKGGKTETLLGFMNQGAEYIGDEWVYISGDGRRVSGIPEPIRLWDWHLHELPRFRALVGRRKRVRLRVLKGIRSACTLAPSSLFERIGQLLQRQLHVDIAPESLFGSGADTFSGNFDRLFFVASHDSPEIVVEPIDPNEVARRMSFSLTYERRDFMALYRMFRFAFPEANNKLIEQADGMQYELLLRVLASKPAYAVYHPYPVSIPALVDAIEPLVVGDVSRHRNQTEVPARALVASAQHERVAAI